MILYIYLASLLLLMYSDAHCAQFQFFLSLKPPSFNEHVFATVTVD